jgi:hypothetical protein
MALPHDTDAEAIPIRTCFSDRELASFLKTPMITVFFVGDRAVSGTSVSRGAIVLGVRGRELPSGA